MFYNKITVGQKVRELRLKKGYTQLQLANLCGYKDKSTISVIECGKRCTAKTIIEIAKNLNTTPEYLLGLDGEKTVFENLLLDLVRQLSPDQTDRLVDYVLQLINE